MGDYYSLNEHQTIVYKAARGAGLDWGAAAEAGDAAYWLAVRRLPACFGEVLSGREKLAAPIAAGGRLTPPANSLLCPLLAGMYISDNAGLPGAPWHLLQTAQPLILAPFVARAAAVAGCRLRLCWDGAELVADHQHTWLLQPNNLSAAHADVVVEHAATPLIAPLPTHACGGEIAPAEWRRLAELAAKTWVPATTESRARGAGAGESDND